MLCEDSVGKGCLAIPQEMGGLPEMVVSQNTAGLIRSRCRRGNGGTESTSGEVSEDEEWTMNNPDKWASTCPRLYELYCEDSSNPHNYFNQANVQLALRVPSDQYLTELESILGELDPVAWQEWKRRAAHVLSPKPQFGLPVPLFDSFTEARAYVFLKRQGYIEMTFLETGGTKGEKVPDLLAKNREGGVTVLEAARIHDSDNEIEYLVNPLPHDMRKVWHGLKGELRAKMRSTVDRARKQLLAFRAAKVRRRIVYLSIRIDLQNATHETRDEIGLFLKKMNDGTIDIVHFIENDFFLSDSRP